MVVPQKGRAVILRELHSGHPGVSRMKALAWMFVWWPKIDEEEEFRGVQNVRKVVPCLLRPHSAPMGMANKTLV